MYNLVFWDWIPSIIQHEYYCRTQAGFWIYKTLEQWKEENHGVFDGLDYDNKKMQKIQDKGNDPDIHNYEINKKIKWEIQYSDIDILGVSFDVGSVKECLIDSVSGELLAKYVGFSVGPGVGGMRFWKMRRCCNDQENQNYFVDFMNSFEGVEQ